MPKYMFTGSYTAEGARGLLKEGGSGRQTGIEVTPAGKGAAAQSSETMAANTNDAAIRASTTAGPARVSGSPTSLPLICRRRRPITRTD